MSEPKNCKCECHQEEPTKEVKHPPHELGEGYRITYKNKTELVRLCKYSGCKYEKREVIS